MRKVRVSPSVKKWADTQKAKGHEIRETKSGRPYAVLRSSSRGTPKRSK